MTIPPFQLSQQAKNLVHQVSLFLNTNHPYVSLFDTSDRIFVAYFASRDERPSKQKPNTYPVEWVEYQRTLKKVAEKIRELRLEWEAEKDQEDIEPEETPTRPPTRLSGTYGKDKEKSVHKPDTPTGILGDFERLHIDSSEWVRVVNELAKPPTVLKTLSFRGPLIYGGPSLAQALDSILFNQPVRKVGYPI